MPKSFKHSSGVLSYEVYGEGQPVMLLHGFGEDSHIWNEQAAFLQPYCQLIVPDLPGSGLSDLLQDLVPEKPVTLDDYADLLSALLQKEQISQCIMLGHSMGGYITLAFAEQYPHMLKAYGLIHSTAFADSEEKKKIRERGIEIIGQYGAFAFLKNTIPNLFGTRFKETQAAKMNQLIEASASFSDASLQQYYRAMILRPDRTAVLKSNRQPVLFVMGTEDTAAPMADVLKQVSLPEISYIHVLQDVGHMGMWEASGQMNQLLLAFINP